MRCFPVIFGLISFLPVADQGQYHLTGSEGPIEAQVGSNPVLPCIVEPPVDMRDGAVEWKLNSSKIVHLFRNGDDDPKVQDERFKGRTSLNHKMMEHGNVSLTLTNVTKNDAGNYTCLVRHLPDLSEKRIDILVVVDGNGNPGGISKDTNVAPSNSPATREPDPGVNVPGWVVPVVVSLIILILIIICAVCWWKREQIFPCWSNNSRNEEVRNDGGMEREQLQNHRGNGNQGDEAEEIHLRIQEEPN